MMAKKKKKAKTIKKASSKKAKKNKAAKKKSKKKGARKGVVTAYLSIGSNVGDREEYVEQALFLLDKNPNVEMLKHSQSYETEPEGGGDQPSFINAAVAVKTKLDPYKLLELCQEIEATLGREREIEWGPRTIDLDILLYGDEIISDDKLSVPHPLMHERMFVLKPLREIAPQVMHPILEKSIAALYDSRKAESGEKYDDELPGFKEIKGGSYDDFERW